MLSKLTIKNVALIERAEICFDKGLNVLSGETGSGKSVIVDSLNFVLGAKADKSLIRSGETECLVVAEFDVCGLEKIYEVYDEFDIEKEDLLIISRKFTIDGKSTIKLNGNSLTVGMLKKFTSNLVDVYGQSEHFDLLSNASQTNLIDKYGAQSILPIKEKLNSIVLDRKNVIKELETFGGDESQRLNIIDLLNYQINEIENCNLKENEEEELKSIREKLSNQEKIVNTLQSIKASISAEGGIDDIISNSVKMASGISNFGEEFCFICDRLNNAYAEIDDISSTIDQMLDNFDFSDINIDEINYRLDVIRGLKRKYGQSYIEIMSFLDNAIIQRDSLINAKESVEKLLIKKQELETNIYNVYQSLDGARRVVSADFANKITVELHELGMAKARFCVSFSDVLPKEDCNFDNVNSFNCLDFNFSANAGEQLKSLSDVISGGEMSRFMLALKSQTAKFNNISTFIFDEIDAGISGNTAKVVAEKFFDISKDVQIIAISHLPQISAMADNNILIEKSEVGDRTITSVKNLNAQEKIYEIVRLSGGEAHNSASIEHAKTVVKNAEDFKNK